MKSNIETYRQFLLDKSRDEGWGKYVKIETETDGIKGYYLDFQTLKRSDFIMETTNDDKL